MPATFASFAPTLTVLDQSHPFRMTVRGAITGPGRVQAAGIITISLPHGAAITSFGFTGSLAFGEVHATLTRNALSPGGTFDFLADRQFTASNRQDFNLFNPISPAHIIDNSKLHVPYRSYGGRKERTSWATVRRDHLWIWDDTKR